MRSNFLPRAVSVTVAALWMAGAARATPSYHLVDLGEAFVAVAINARDEVVAEDLLLQPMVYRNGAWQHLPVRPRSAGAVPTALSADGTVSGIIGDIDAVVWTPKGRLVRILHPGLAFRSSLQALALTDDDTVIGAGQLYYGLALPSWMFTWRDDGTFDLIGVPPGGSSARPAAVNGLSQIVGQAAFAGQGLPGHAFRYESGQWLDLGTLGGATSQANGINGEGHVVGCADTPVAWAFHAFLYQDGSMTDLGSPDDTTSCAAGVSDDDTVIGTWNLSGKNPKPFIWKNGRMFTKIANLTDGGETWSYWQLDAINAAGVIAGLGEHDGQRHVFLLEPVARAPSAP